MADDFYIRLIELKPEIARAHCVFWAGSLAEGFGNNLSDIDVFAIYRTEPPSKHGYEEVMRIGGRTVELITLVEGNFERVLAELDKGCNSMDRLSWYDLVLVHRVMTGRILVGSQHLISLRTLLARDNQLQKYLARWHCDLAADAYEDTVGTYLEDVETAAFNGRRMIESAFDAYLASHGNTSPLSKWRLRYSKRLLKPKDDFTTDFIRLSTHIPFQSDEGKCGYVLEACQFLQRVLDTMHRAEFNIPTPQGRDAGELRKVPMAHVRNIEEGFILFDGSRKYKISGGPLLTWLLIGEPSTVRAVEQSWSELAPTWKLDPSADTMHLSLEQLVQMGSIVDIHAI